MNDDTKELKKRWKFFLFYGLAILIIGTIIQFELNQWLNSRAQGPPCRIDFSKEKFPMTNSTFFNLQYLLINLRDGDLLIDGIDNYCYWQTKEELESKKDTLIEQQPITREISAPLELDKLSASKSEVRTAVNCKSPVQEGVYNVKIIVRTTAGNCEGNVLMEVKK
jgi:hypothetical protein